MSAFSRFARFFIPVYPFSFYSFTLSASRSYACFLGFCGVKPRRFKYSPAVRTGIVIPYRFSISFCTASRVQSAKSNRNCSGYLLISIACMPFSCFFVNVRPSPCFLPTILFRVIASSAFFPLKLRYAIHRADTCWRVHPVAYIISQVLKPDSIIRIIVRLRSSCAPTPIFLPSIFSMFVFYHLYIYLVNNFIAGSVIKYSMDPDQKWNYFSPNIPYDVMQNAIDSYVSLDDDEYIVFIRDLSSFFDKPGARGFCYSSKALYFAHGSYEWCLPYAAINSIDFVSAKTLSINNGELVIEGDRQLFIQIKKVLDEIREAI
jgi:hypothetical protein